MRSALAIAEYGDCIKENFKGFLAAPKSQTTSFTFIIYYCYVLRESLKTLTLSAPINNFYRGF